MKRVALVMGTILLTGAVWLALPCGTTLFAAGGCCKKKVGDNWQKQRNMSFNECNKRNKSDGDSVVIQSGTWWWDTKC